MSLLFPIERGSYTALKKAGAIGKKFDHGLGCSQEICEDILYDMDIELHGFHTTKHGQITLTIDAVDPRLAMKIVRKLQKKAVPKSEWKYRGAWTDMGGKHKTVIVFEARGE